MTTPVVARTCGQDGHVTRFISACNSSTYVLVSCGHFANSIEFLPTSPNDQYSFRGFDLEHLEPHRVVPWLARRGHHHPPRKSGRGRGIRTPTRGFGDRWSSR